MRRKGQDIDSSIPWRFPRRGSLVARCARWGAPAGDGGGARAECRSTPPVRTPHLLNTFPGSFCCAVFHNDPFAVSPTETLLRLLLPLNDKVQWTSCDVAGSKPPMSPRSKHFTGSFNRYAHTRTLLRRSRSVGGAPLGGIPPISFLGPYGFTRPLTHTHVRLLGPCFKTGRMGRPQASVRSAQMPKHAGDARCLPQSRRWHSTSISSARALAAPQSTLVHALGRSAYRLVAVPHPTGAHRRPPSASLLTISSTL
ncbi:hypothetical protein CQW23_34951 [Capsicum baccatum]|uniref:Protein TAR1 n=1 Tax=Capsicum baccatum TaxID=33114 RepID=A0A2G2UXR5_CAPBA|nr:hypothetical protein CQW23_34951 [Capsicum baccatum]